MPLNSLQQAAIDKLIAEGKTEEAERRRKLFEESSTFGPAISSPQAKPLTTEQTSLFPEDQPPRPTAPKVNIMAGTQRDAYNQMISDEVSRGVSYEEAQEKAAERIYHITRAPRTAEFGSPIEPLTQVTKPTTILQALRPQVVTSDAITKKPAGILVKEDAPGTLVPGTEKYSETKFGTALRDLTAAWRPVTELAREAFTWPVNEQGELLDPTDKTYKVFNALPVGVQETIRQTPSFGAVSADIARNIPNALAVLPPVAMLKAQALATERVGGAPTPLQPILSTPEREQNTYWQNVIQGIARGEFTGTDWMEMPLYKAELKEQGQPDWAPLAWGVAAELPLPLTPAGAPGRILKAAAKGARIIEPAGEAARGIESVARVAEAPVSAIGSKLVDVRRASATKKVVSALGDTPEVSADIRPLVEGVTDSATVRSVASKKLAEEYMAAALVSNGSTKAINLVRERLGGTTLGRELADGTPATVLKTKADDLLKKGGQLGNEAKSLAGESLTSMTGKLDVGLLTAKVADTLLSSVPDNMVFVTPELLVRSKVWRAHGPDIMQEVRKVGAGVAEGSDSVRFADEGAALAALKAAKVPMESEMWIRIVDAIKDGKPLSRQDYLRAYEAITTQVVKDKLYKIQEATAKAKGKPMAYVYSTPRRASLQTELASGRGSAWDRVKSLIAPEVVHPKGLPLRAVNVLREAEAKKALVVDALRRELSKEKGQDALNRLDDILAEDMDTPSKWQRLYEETAETFFGHIPYSRAEVAAYIEKFVAAPNASPPTIKNIGNLLKELSENISGLRGKGLVDTAIPLLQDKAIIEVAIVQAVKNRLRDLHTETVRRLAEENPKMFPSSIRDLKANTILGNDPAWAGEVERFTSKDLPTIAKNIDEGLPSPFPGELNPFLKAADRVGIKDGRWAQLQTAAIDFERTLVKQLRDLRNQRVADGIIPKLTELISEDGELFTILRDVEAKDLQKINDLISNGTLERSLEALRINDGPGAAYIGTLVDALRSRFYKGVLYGQGPLPNLPYHVTNALTAPLISAVTIGEGKTLAALKEYPVVLGRRLYNWAAKKSFGRPEDVLFTDTRGRPWTRQGLQNSIDSQNIKGTMATFEFGQEVLRDIKKELQVKNVRDSVEAVGGKGKVLRWLDPRGTNFWVDFANATDRTFRESVYVSALKAGASEADAAKLARESILDYGAIPAAERKYVARWVLFYAFNRQMTLATLKAILLRPNTLRKMALWQQFQQKKAYDWKTPDAYKSRLWQDVEHTEQDTYNGLYSMGNPTLEAIEMLFNLAESPAEEIEGTLPPEYKLAVTLAKGKRGKPSDRHIYVAKQLGIFPWFTEYFDLVPVSATGRKDVRTPGKPEWDNDQWTFNSTKGWRRYQFAQYAMVRAGLRRVVDDYTNALVQAGVVPEGMEPGYMRTPEGHFLLTFTGLKKSFRLPSDEEMQANKLWQIQRELEEKAKP